MIDSRDKTKVENVVSELRKNFGNRVYGVATDLTLKGNKTRLCISWTRLIPIPAIIMIGVMLTTFSRTHSLALSCHRA